MVNYRESFFKIMKNDGNFLKYLSNYKFNPKPNCPDLPIIEKKLTNSNFNNNIDYKNNTLIKSDTNFLKKDKSTIYNLQSSSVVSHFNMTKDIMRNSASISKKWN